MMKIVMTLMMSLNKGLRFLIIIEREEIAEEIAEVVGEEEAEEVVTEEDVEEEKGEETVDKEGHLQHQTK